jgi:hypothetical protein
MGKDIRKYTRGKGMKWKKGESSSSNPTTKTYRAAAKNSFFQYKIGEKSNEFGILIFYLQEFA